MSENAIQALENGAMSKTVFGHTYAQAGNTFIDSWSVGPFVIHFAGKTYRFEDGDMFGPAPLRKDGEIKEPGYFAEKNPFWHAWELWVDQGRRTLEDGITCVWEHEGDRP